MCRNNGHNQNCSNTYCSCAILMLNDAGELVPNRTVICLDSDCLAFPPPCLHNTDCTVPRGSPKLHVNMAHAYELNMSPCARRRARLSVMPLHRWSLSGVCNKLKSRIYQGSRNIDVNCGVEYLLTVHPRWASGAWSPLSLSVPSQPPAVAFSYNFQQLPNFPKFTQIFRYSLRNKWGISKPI